MNDEQKHKLRKVLELVENILGKEDDMNFQFSSVELSVAGDYCKEVAKEIGKNDK